MGVERTMWEDSSSTSSRISSVKMNTILESLKHRTTRDSTLQNYITIWRCFNKFLMKLDRRPPSWEDQIALFAAHQIQAGTQSSMLRLYFSALKKILRDDGYKLNEDLTLFSSLARACKLENDILRMRFPIHINFLEILVFELERIFIDQRYLELLYKSIFLISYYGLFRIGEVTKSNHVIKAADFYLGRNKNKILVMLYSSKTHTRASIPQKVKISEINCSARKQFFCPFMVLRKFLELRGNYKDQDEQLFIFRDHSPVLPEHVRTVLRKTIRNTGLDTSLYNCQSFQIGCCDLIKMGYSVETVKRLGRWKSNAVYKYIRP